MKTILVEFTSTITVALKVSEKEEAMLEGDYSPEREELIENINDRAGKFASRVLTQHIDQGPFNIKTNLDEMSAIYDKDENPYYQI